MERDLQVFANFNIILYFNSHAHVERDSAQTFVRDMVTNFNSHAHVERDAVCEQEIKGYFNFNSHAHVERDGNLFKI